MVSGGWRAVFYASVSRQDCTKGAPDLAYHLIPALLLVIRSERFRERVISAQTPEYIIVRDVTIRNVRRLSIAFRVLKMYDFAFVSDRLNIVLVHVRRQIQTILCGKQSEG